jgi:NAD(P)-dependent dehydrogenase (short-subunit alcohol dehydrogenase family)
VDGPPGERRGREHLSVLDSSAARDIRRLRVVARCQVVASAPGIPRFLTAALIRCRSLDMSFLALTLGCPGGPDQVRRQAPLQSGAAGGEIVPSHSIDAAVARSAFVPAVAGSLLAVAASARGTVAPPPGWQASSPPPRLLHLPATPPQALADGEQTRSGVAFGLPQLRTPRGHIPANSQEVMDTMRFTDRVAIVTGGAGGIGGELCRELAREGARVVIADVDLTSARQLASELDAVAIEMDVTDPDSVATGVETARERCGTPRLLFNVAGISGGHGPLRTLAYESLQRAFDVNVKGTFLVMQAVVRQMLEAQREGAIVNVGSASAVQPTIGLGHYGATKAAVHTLTKAAAVELAPLGIRVNAVAPGPVYTPMTERSMADPDHRAKWEARIPLGRIAQPRDLVPLMLLLASEESGYMTGSIVSIDGGRLLV